MSKVALSPQQQNVKTIQSLMEQYKGEIAKALPKHMTADRMARVALTCLRVNPKLAECDPLSFMGAIIQASALGLEPGSQGHAYLIPFRNKKKGIVECQFIPGYRGLIDLARRSGQIESIAAHIVKENDHFDFEYGLNEKLIHKPARGDRGANVYVYAVAKLKGGGYQFEVMDMQQIYAIRDRRPYENDVWKTDFDEMARKTAVRRIYKYLPTSVEMANAMYFDEMHDKDIPQGNRAVIDASYVTDFVAENDPIDIKEINAEADAAKETEEKKQAVAMFMKKRDELTQIGWKPEDFAKKLNVTKLDEILLKDSKTIYAAIEVLQDET